MRFILVVNLEYLHFCKFRLEEEPNWNVLLFIKIFYIKTYNQLLFNISQSLPKDELQIDPEFLGGVTHPEPFPYLECIIYGKLYFKRPHFLNTLRRGPI